MQRMGVGRYKKEYKKIIITDIPDNIPEKFINKLLGNIHTNNKGCWVRGNDSTIYTNIKWNGKFERAHRVSYEIFNGVKIPKELCGCHKCDVKACVNPKHIFIGSTAMNMQDAIIKRRVFSPRVGKNKWAEFPKLRKLIKGY